MRISRGLACAAILAFVGCQKPVYFPLEPMAAAAPASQRAYDTDGDGRQDFLALLNGQGRIDRIAYDLTGDGKALRVVDLDAIPFAQCRHLAIVLDGVGYDLVRQYYDEGHLRLFHPPSRVIAPYPSMTDVALEDLLGYMPVKGFEAEYYDRASGKMAGGSRAYLRGENTPYNRLFHYRADLILDAVAYVLPWQVYGKEINDSKRLWDRRTAQELRAYYVSAAGVATKRGAEGHRACLQKIEQLIHQVIWETGGLTKVTMLADHGHTYTPPRRIALENHLKARSWRLVESLRDDRDVAYVRFGLETYVALSTRSPAALARDAVDCQGVELASFAENDTVVVLAPGGQRAVVTRKAGRFGYQAASGDPLRLNAILAGLKGDAEGRYDANELLAATVTHYYPAPLQRLWRAHFAMVEKAADVILSLGDEWYSGSRGFDIFANIASTHGGLNYRNSTTFIMSTVGPLPAVMRSADIPRHMKALTGREWPAGR